LLFEPVLNSNLFQSLKVAWAQAEMREVVFSCSFFAQLLERFAWKVFTFRAKGQSLLRGAVPEAAFGALRHNDARSAALASDRFFWDA
jgi:hypothetical protein